MSVVGTVGATAGKLVLSKLVDKIFQVAKTSLDKVQRERWEQAAVDVEELWSHATDLRMVKTILHLEKPVDLDTFYHPARVLSHGNELHPETTEDLPTGQLVVLEAPVGRGKSILLRRLASKDLIHGARLPIFIELRVLGEHTLAIEVGRQLAQLGLPLSAAGVEVLLASGDAVILLDGFDELRLNQQQTLVQEVERLVATHEKLRIIVTSRPDTPIAYSRKSIIAELLPLSETEWRQVLRKFEPDVTTQRRILSEVGDQSPLTEVLVTPLMVALLVLRFRLQQTVPENIESFYNNLFHLLIDRHDKISKSGYLRHRTSQLGDAELERTFNAFCWLSCRKDSIYFDRREALERARGALDALTARADPSFFLQDIVRITGLLAEDGGEYSFVHKSVAEYHAALCIRSQADDVAAKFYGRILQHPQDSSLWGILTFLKQLDRDRLLINFWQPLLDALLNPPRQGVTTDIRHSVAATADGYGQKLFAAQSLYERIGLLRNGAIPGEEALVRVSNAVTERFKLDEMNPEPDDIMSVRTGTEGAIAQWNLELGRAIQRARSTIRGIAERKRILMFE